MTSLLMEEKLVLNPVGSLAVSVLPHLYVAPQPRTLNEPGKLQKAVRFSKALARVLVKPAFQ